MNIGSYPQPPSSIDNEIFPGMLDSNNLSNESFFISNLISKDLNHKIFNKPILSNYDKNLIVFGMGCFWGVENCSGVLMVLI